MQCLLVNEGAVKLCVEVAGCKAEALGHFFEPGVYLLLFRMLFFRLLIWAFMNSIPGWYIA